MHLRFSMVQQFFSHLPKIRSRQYLFISSRKSCVPLKLSTAYRLDGKETIKCQFNQSFLYTVDKKHLKRNQNSII